MNGRLTLDLPLAPATADGVLVVLPDGTSLSYERAVVALEVERDPGGRVAAEARLDGVVIALSADASALLAAIGLRAASRFPVGSVGLGWRDGRLALVGSGTLGLSVPVNATLGPLTARTFHVGVHAPEDGVALEATLDLELDLAGGIAVSLAGVGLRAALAGIDLRDGLPLHVGSLPPAGGGLALDLGVVAGGGSLSVDEEAGAYAGAFAARLLGVGVTAVGVVSTKPVLSLIASLSADLRPVGIELSFGFTLNAVGGLVGLNRGCDAEQLREGVRTGAIDALMFPADPIRNAPRIIADLGRVFPAREGQVVVAPMLELGWGKPAGMIALRLALIVQAPDPLIQIAGTVAVEIPPGLGAAALIRLKAAFVAGVDPGRQLVTLDASLIDSHLLFATLEGDVALRFRYGGRPDFLVSAGGFFPRYAPPADLALGPMRRLAVAVGGPGPVRMESYFAVTTNTVQHGAFVEIRLEVDDGYGVSGSLGYDVVVVLDPFAFTAEVAAHFRVEAFGETLCGVDVEGSLSGPHPLHLEARGSFRVLFVRISVPISITFGDSGAIAPPERVRVREAIAGLLARPGAVEVERPRSAAADAIVLREGTDPALVSPDGELVVRQSLVPLGVGIDRVGAARPADGRVFEVGLAAGGEGGLVVGARPTDHFAPAQFFDLSQEEKLSRPAFEDHLAGILIGGDGRPALAGTSPADFDAEAVVIDAENRSARLRALRLDAAVSARLALGGVAALAKERLRPPAVAVGERGERFGVVDVATGLRLAEHATAGEARALLAERAGAQPALRDRLRVVSMLDLAA